MVSRSTQLFLIELKSIAHKVRYDFARELVVAICSAVVLGLFYYVFNDFLNVEIKQLSTTMRDSLGKWASYGVFLVAAIFTGRRIGHRFKDDNGLAKYAYVMGESPKTLKQLNILSTVTLVLIIYGLTFYVAVTHLYLWQALPLAVILVVMSIVSALSFWIVKKPNRHYVGDKSPLLKSANASPLKILMSWRLKQMLYRNRLTQSTLIIAAVTACLTGSIAFVKLPLFVAILNSFLASVLAATAMSFQIADDLGYAWAERNLGVSHEIYTKALARIALLIGLAIGICSGLSWFLAKLVISAGIDQSVVSESLKISVIAIIPIWLLPKIVFQIDAKRPVIQILIVILIGLFLITAVYAHWLGLLLLPILKYYADQSQQGRFYRA